MEVVMNQMLKLGADKKRLVAKVFGGATVLEGMEALNIGDQNSAFVLGFLREEEIPVLAQDLQGNSARKVYFFPRTGKVLVKRLGGMRNDTVEQRERDYLRSLDPRGGEVEIFRRP
jgi:chemotaxis protein CheD